MKALVIKQPGEAVAAQDTVALTGCGGVGLGAIAASHFAGASYDRGGRGRCEVECRQEGRGRLRRQYIRVEEAPALLRAWPENSSRFSKIMVSMEQGIAHLETEDFILQIKGHPWPFQPR